jgi:hypothetical protein
MRTLDQEGQRARGAVPGGPTADEATEFLRNLPELWDQAEPSGRKLLAEELFERIDVLGARKVRLHPSASVKAQGWDRAWNGVRLVEMVGARGSEPAIPTCRIVVPSWIAASLGGKTPAPGPLAVGYLVEKLKQPVDPEMRGGLSSRPSFVPCRSAT